MKELKKEFNIQFIPSKPIRSFGTVQLRCLQPAEYLSDHGYNVKVENIRGASPIFNGLIIFHRTSYNSFTIALAKAAKYSGNILVYETDDLTLNYGNRKNFCELCDAISVSTEFLKTEFYNYGKNIRVLKNALSKEFFDKANQKTNQLNTKDDNVTLAFFSGSSTHDEDFKIIEKTLLIILKNHLHVKLLICGKIKFSDNFYLFKERFEHKEFMPYAEFIEIYKKVDINLVPLTDTKFNHGKSELKFIEAGAFSITTLASDCDTYSRVINHEKNGILISKNESWNFWIEKLIYDQNLRNKLGNAAREFVIKNYNPSVRASEYHDFINDLTSKIERKSNRFLYSYYMIIASLNLYGKILKSSIKLSK